MGRLFHVWVFKRAWPLKVEYSEGDSDTRWNVVQGRRRGQIRQGLAGHLKEFEFYSKSHGKPLKVFKGCQCHMKVKTWSDLVWTDVTINSSVVYGLSGAGVCRDYTGSYWGGRQEKKCWWLWIWKKWMNFCYIRILNQQDWPRLVDF